MGNEKHEKKEQGAPQGQGKPQAGGDKKNSEGHASGHASGHSSAPAAGGKKGAHNPAPGGCHSVGCKVEAKRFNFCDEHYEQFKFGLIKKSGELVSDYEKKFEHYQAYKTKRSAHKVA